MKALALKSMTLMLAALSLSTVSCASRRPPKLVAPSAGAVLPQPQTGSWIFEWKPVPNASSYQIEVLGPKASVPLVHAVTSSNRYVLPPNQGYIAARNLKGWTWRVRVQDKKGVWGAWSAQRQFDVSSLSIRPASPQAPRPALPLASGGYYIRGELSDTAGNPVPGASVCRKEPRGRTCIFTDWSGGFVMVVSGEGTYEVMPGSLPVRPATEIFTPNDEYPAVSAGQEVKLDSAHREANIVLTLPGRNPELLLKVLDETTQAPVELVVIQVCYAHQLLRCGGNFFRSDTGEYKIHVPSSDFNLDIRAPGYEEWASFDNGDMRPGSTQNVEIRMRRPPETLGEALSEQEKKAGVHLPAPVQISPLEGEKFIGFPRTTTLQWEKVQGAARYEVEVDYCQSTQGAPVQCVLPAPYIFDFPDVRPPKKHGTEDTSLTFDFIGAQPGRWRVCALDKDGRKGFKSSWRLFIYAR